ncbi:major facilitator superfamily domain-containing protein [Phascolomyces articulosus]|uniref:Major facilitator superfamily domain-containing protein n=1 Tax=Phascolomyces articulosus TaxID=60185 RepID=A0AAD5PH77_9FUNG|nr:major facilitator superfamily domain-containing protein [Phascolomyces articulosus]
MTDADQKTPLLQQQHKPPVSRPKYRRRRSSFDPSTYNSTGQSLPYVKPNQLETTDPGLGLLQILGLTICMAGVQFTWTVELSYGTPYLLSLDISKELTALVWLAGPLSGLLVQPLIGALSDKSTSRFGKRRPFIVVAGILTCFSMLGVAYAKEIGEFASRIMHGDPAVAGHTNAIIVAVVSFYFMDFTLNGVQAICRALILDIPPLWQQELANAWSARMSNAAQVIGYFVGFIDLVKIAPWLGDSQMKGFCIVAIVVFIITLGITCLAVHEKPLEREDDQDMPWYHTLAYIWRAFTTLPKEVQSLCNTQFFAWMGWFPFLFYSTQWVSDIYFSTHPSDDDRNWAEGTRAGSFALLCYSVCSVIAGVVIPAIAAKYEKVRLFRLDTIYTTSLLISAAALLATWFTRSVAAATVILTIMGVPWAIVLWIPFSLVGEYVSFEDERRQKLLLQQQTVNTPSSSSSESPRQLEEVDQKEEFDAGMMLGVHNIYIVMPQFVTAACSSFIFAATASDGKDEAGSSNVATVLAFGGLMSLIAAGFSRYIKRVK